MPAPMHCMALLAARLIPLDDTRLIPAFAKLASSEHQLVALQRSNTEGGPSLDTAAVTDAPNGCGFGNDGGSPSRRRSARRVAPGERGQTAAGQGTESA